MLGGSGWRIEKTLLVLAGISSAWSSNEYKRQLSVPQGTQNSVQGHDGTEKRLLHRQRPMEGRALRHVTK